MNVTSVLPNVDRPLQYIPKLAIVSVWEKNVPRVGVMENDSFNTGRKKNEKEKNV